MCLFDAAKSAQLVLETFRNYHSIRFVPLHLQKCKKMYHDWHFSEPNLTIHGVHPGVTDRSTKLSSCLSSDGSIGSDVNTHISNARVAYTFNALAVQRWCFTSWKRLRVQRYRSFRFNVGMWSMAALPSCAQLLSVWSSLLVIVV